MQQRISSEFAGFVRDTGVRAFDRLTMRTGEIEAPLRPVLRAWNKLSEDQKNELFNVLIATLLPEPEADPSPPKKRSRSRSVPKDADGPPAGKTGAAKTGRKSSAKKR